MYHFCATPCRYRLCVFCRQMGLISDVYVFLFLQYVVPKSSAVVCVILIQKEFRSLLSQTITTVCPKHSHVFVFFVIILVFIAPFLCVCAVVYFMWRLCRVQYVADLTC